VKAEDVVISGERFAAFTSHLHCCTGSLLQVSNFAAHRNRGLTTSLTSLHDELRAQEREKARRDRRKGKKFSREDEMVDPDYTPNSDYTP